jgi:hypothetical protein
MHAFPYSRIFLRQAKATMERMFRWRMKKSDQEPCTCKSHALPTEIIDIIFPCLWIWIFVEHDVHNMDDDEIARLKSKLDCSNNIIHGFSDNSVRIVRIRAMRRRLEKMRRFWFALCRPILMETSK